MYHSTLISHDLFPQLDGSSSACHQPQLSALGFSTAANTTSASSGVLNSNQSMYDPSFYYYSGQVSTSSNAALVASSILDCEDVLFPSNVSATSSTSYNNEPITTSTSYQLMQSSLSSCYTSQGESPLSIESDTFHQQNQQHQLQQFYIYGSPMDLNASSDLYDMAVQQSTINAFPPLPTSSTLHHVGQHQPHHHHQRNPSSSSTASSSGSSMSSPASVYSGSSFSDDHIHHTSMRSGSLFQCEYKGCTKAFTRTYNLKSHRRTHTDEKPFVCDMCPKAFARQHDRNRHAKLHLGLKPFPCSFCDKSFARQDALNRHLKRDKKKNAVQITRQEDISILPPPCLLLKIKQKQKANLKKKKQLL